VRRAAQYAGIECVYLGGSTTVEGIYVADVDFDVRYAASPCRSAGTDEVWDQAKSCDEEDLPASYSPVVFL